LRRIHNEILCNAQVVTSHVSHITFDSRDAFAQSVWWGDLLGMAGDPEDPNEPGDEECKIFSLDGQTPILFIQVPDGKQVKNRLHFDLRPVDGSREQEVERLVSLGAAVVADRRRPDGSGWFTLADPEGNEFCILGSEHEVDET
jgi:predicted enzyme related to lactoylglutathione lyase